MKLEIEEASTKLRRKLIKGRIREKLTSMHQT